MSRPQLPERPVRVTIRVRPGASRTAVRGRYGDALVVAVTAPPVDGRATEAALTALAEALGVPRRTVRLVTGASSRTKVVEVEQPPGGMDSRVAELLDG